MCALICVLSYVCSYVSSHICALVCLLSCAFTCLLLCALICVSSSSSSSPLVSPFSRFSRFRGSRGFRGFRGFRVFAVFAVFAFSCPFSRFRVFGFSRKIASHHRGRDTHISCTGRRRLWQNPWQHRLKRWAAHLCLFSIFGDFLVWIAMGFLKGCYTDPDSCHRSFGGAS